MKKKNSFEPLTIFVDVRLGSKHVSDVWETFFDLRKKANFLKAKTIFCLLFSHISTESKGF